MDETTYALDDTRGQYVLDHAFDSHDPRLRVDPAGVKASRGDGDSAMHDEELSLYDEGSTVLPDPATGRAPRAADHDYTHHLVEEGNLRVVSARDLNRPLRAAKPDAADLWLAEYSRKHPQKVGEKALALSK